MLTKQKVKDILNEYALDGILDMSLFEIVAGDLVRASKREKKATSPFHSACMDVYFEWHKERFGVPPKVDYLQALALKKIIEYLSALQSVKDGTHTVTGSFEAILNNWSRLDKFMQSRTKLSEINTDLSKIIIQIKNSRNVTYTDNELSSAIADEARKRTEH